MLFFFSEELCIAVLSRVRCPRPPNTTHRNTKHQIEFTSCFYSSRNVQRSRKWREMKRRPLRTCRVPWCKRGKGGNRTKPRDPGTKIRNPWTKPRDTGTKPRDQGTKPRDPETTFRYKGTSLGNQWNLWPLPSKRFNIRSLFLSFTRNHWNQGTITTC